MCTAHQHPGREITADWLYDPARTPAEFRAWLQWNDPNGDYDEVAFSDLQFMVYTQAFEA